MTLHLNNVHNVISLVKCESAMNHVCIQNKYVTVHIRIDLSYTYKKNIKVISLCVAVAFESRSNVQAMASNLLAPMTVLVTSNSK